MNANEVAARIEGVFGGMRAYEVTARALGADHILMDDGNSTWVIRVADVTEVGLREADERIGRPDGQPAVDVLEDALQTWAESFPCIDRDRDLPADVLLAAREVTGRKRVCRWLFPDRDESED